MTKTNTEQYTVVEEFPNPNYNSILETIRSRSLLSSQHEMNTLKDNKNKKDYPDENFLIEVSSSKYQENFDILDKNGYSINKIQNEMLALGKIKESEIGIFGKKTTYFIYEYHPNYYVIKNNNSDIVKRANNLIELNNGINKEKTINAFHNDLLGYEKATNYNGNKGRGWREYLLEINDKKNYGNLGALKKYKTFPKENTALAEGLYNVTKREKKLEGLDKSNNIYIFRNSYNNKFTLHYYLGGKLRVCTYVSLGNPKAEGGGQLTHLTENKRVGGPLFMEKNYISNSINPKNINKDKTAWVMPLAIKINNFGEFLHVSRNVNGELASHGCVRVPPFYEKVLYSYLENLSSYITILDNK